MTEQIDLSPLKDLHLMDHPSWWPLAYGWWVLFGICLIACLLGLILRKWWLSRPIVYAVHEIKYIRSQALSDLDFLHALSDLMKRVALFKFGRERISLLTEEKWQSFLMKTGSHVLTQHQAKLIAFSPYLMRIKERINRDIFSRQAELWIREILKK